MTNNEERKLLAFVNALKPVTANQDMKFNCLHKHGDRWGYFNLGSRTIWFEIEHDLVFPCKEDIENHNADLLIVLHNNIELYCLLSYLKRILNAPMLKAFTSLTIDKQTKN